MLRNENLEYHFIERRKKIKYSLMQQLFMNTLNPSHKNSLFEEFYPSIWMMFSF